MGGDGRKWMLYNRQDYVKKFVKPRVAVSAGNKAASILHRRSRKTTNIQMHFFVLHNCTTIFTVKGGQFLLPECEGIIGSLKDRYFYTTREREKYFVCGIYQGSSVVKHQNIKLEPTVQIPAQIRIFPSNI